MCTIKEGFKLCTCAKELKHDKADWLLYRLDSRSKAFLTIGLMKI